MHGADSTLELMLMCTNHHQQKADTIIVSKKVMESNTAMIV